MNQLTQFKKTKSTCCWKAGWVYKDSVVTSFRNQNYWLEMVIPPNLPAHSQGSSVYYRFQSFPRRVTLNDKHTNSNQCEQSISQICVTTTTKDLKHMPHFSEMKRSIKHLVIIKLFWSVSFSCSQDINGHILSELHNGIKLKVNWARKRHVNDLYSAFIKLWA